MTRWRGVGRCGLVGTRRCSARARRRFLMRTARVVRAVANVRVCGVAGTVVITYARGEGGARSVGVCRAWRTGRALGMVVERLGMVCARGPGAGISHGWDGGGV